MNTLYPSAVRMFAISWSVAENAIQCQALQREVGLYKGSSALGVAALRVLSVFTVKAV